MAVAHALLALEQVKVRFGGVTALDVPALRIGDAPGIGTVILGVNGAGKTTLLNAISGYAAIGTAGRIRWHHGGGTDLQGRSPAAIVRTGLGRTFQNPPVFPSLSVGEVLGLASRFGRRPDLPPLTREAVAAVAEMFALNVEQSPASLSLAAARRLDLARALVCGPRLLLLDEPTSGLAHDDRASLVAFLGGGLSRFMAQTTGGTAAAAPVSIGVITHDVLFLEQLRAARLLAHARLVFMRSGRVEAAGPFDEIISDRRVREGYFGQS